MEKEDFGRHVAQLVAADKWNEIVSLMHGIGLPPDWKEMVKPLFEGFLGQKVEASIIPASEIPEHQLV
ncbi:MAG: hypothetical protein FJZ95_10140, partial [Chloroflexi bacterium]|nr:hypothetical protein [Chloroflexota bacterium]